MRIVAGSLRGRTIEAPSGDGTRPTSDRVREALFSSLYSLRGGLEGAVVLDAFAGSGALGIEALSRGARSAFFYERNARAVAVVKRNLAACKLDDGRARVVQRDVLGSPPVSHGDPFDLVFLDPPYRYSAEGVLGMVAELRCQGALADDAIVVYEHDAGASVSVMESAREAGFALRTSKKYGKTAVDILMPA